MGYVTANDITETSVFFFSKRKPKINPVVTVNPRCGNLKGLSYCWLVYMFVLQITCPCFQWNLRNNLSMTKTQLPAEQICFPSIIPNGSHNRNDWLWKAVIKTHNYSHNLLQVCPSVFPFVFAVFYVPFNFWAVSFFKLRSISQFDGSYKLFRDIAHLTAL